MCYNNFLAINANEEDYVETFTEQHIEYYDLQPKNMIKHCQ